MTEQDVREGLRGAVAGEPPLDFDAHALVETARRQARRRRAQVSAGLATAVVAVAAVAVPVTLGITRDQGGVEAGDRPVVQSSQEPTQQPTSRPRPSTYTAGELHQRGDEMRAHLKARLPEIMPGIGEVSVQPFGGEATGDVSDGQTYLNTFAVYTLAGARYGIGVNVFAPGGHPGLAETCDPNPERCQTLGDEGGQLVAVDEDLENSSMKIVSVYHFRTDGSVVSAVGYNYDPTGIPQGTDVNPIPVTTEQLGRLAVDPAIGL